MIEVSDGRNIPPGAWPVLKTLGSEGENNMADNTKTSFKTMGTDAAYAENISGAPSANTSLVAKKNTQSGPVPGVKANRKGTLERNGFQGAPQVAYSYPQAPEAANTFRNVRLMPSAKGNRDFYARRQEGPVLVAPPFPGGSWTPPNKP